MQIHLLKSKIHRATVTGGNVNYEGSLTISGDILDKVGLREYERILCGNMANGNRWETYIIRGKSGAGGQINSSSPTRPNCAGNVVRSTAWPVAERR